MTEKNNLEEKIIKVQTELKAPKNQYNGFGKYKYRSCEDILEAVKPLLAKYNLFMRIDDNIINIGGRFYIKSTIQICDTEGSCTSVSALAREEESKKGMDCSQVTGASSSYARKYALNGMFLIDDTKDSDCTNTHDHDKEIKKEEKEPVLTVESFTKRFESFKDLESLEKEVMKKETLAEYNKFGKEDKEAINKFLANKKESLKVVL